MKPFILGTRGSALALAQVDLTRAALAKALPDLTVEQQVFVTRGDQKLDLSLIRANEAGGKGLFTKELEDALLSGTIDVAVHSLKDLPGHNPEGLTITAVLERAATGDVLISKEAPTFEALPDGSVIGTSSVRRARQLRWLRPDFEIVEWRGNVQTRLRKLGESESAAGIVLAQAGLERLGYDLSSGVLEFGGQPFRVSSLEGHMFPAIGQGAIALQSRADRLEVAEILARIDHAETHATIRGERELQRLLSGDCALPVGVRSQITSGRLEMKAILFGAEDQPPKHSQAEGEVENPESVARELFAGLQ